MTLTPVLNHSASTQIQSYDMSQCGAWATYQTYQQESTGGLPSTSTSPPTTTAFAPSGINLGDWWDPSGMALTLDPCPTMSTFEYWLEYMDPDVSSEDWKALKGCGLNITYDEPVSSQVPDGSWQFQLPDGLIPWLAEQPDIVSQFPYIGSCWPLSAFHLRLPVRKANIIYRVLRFVL